MLLFLRAMRSQALTVEYEEQVISFFMFSRREMVGSLNVIEARRNNNARKLLDFCNLHI